ncbi:MAG TPA: DUF222 domain-containing protein [Polyangiales bacterium]|nr:DUF222 domain-containing protein [Polyangiales bacterium]
MSDDIVELSDASLEQALTTLVGHLNAGNFRFLELLAEFDRRGGHVGIGLASCAHWLSWRCGIGLVAAREKVRVARALVGLPRVADAMRRGVLSYCKVRALTRIATPENEGSLLSIAEKGSVSHVERVVRLYRGAQCAEELEQANERFAGRYLQCYVDETGAVVVKALLAPEQGAVFMKALRGAADVLREAEGDSGESLGAPDRAVDSYSARNADALGLMAEGFLADGARDVTGPDRQLVTIHVAEGVLRDEAAQGRCELDDQTLIPPATARRLACDASLVEITENHAGEPLKLGRKRRVVSAALRRALAARDRGCRFPGCTNHRFVDAHHIVHWIDEGETDPDNLVLLCRRHHRFLHEYGYSVVRNGSEFEFRRPDGRVIHHVPPSVGVDSATGCARLQATHEQAGVSIDHDTGDSHWGGEKLDYNWVLEWLYERERERGAAGACS